MHEKTGFWPVFLLDEVLAELDLQRRNDLLSRLLACEQTILTTTDLDLFASHLLEQASIYRIENGQITPKKELTHE